MHCTSRYGPFWICTTLTFLSAALGNLASYLSFALYSPADATWHYNIRAVSWAAGIFYGYCSILPCSSSSSCAISSASAGLIQLWCLYGYSLAIFIPISVRRHPRDSTLVQYSGRGLYYSTVVQYSATPLTVLLWFSIAFAHLVPISTPVRTIHYRTLALQYSTVLYSDSMFPYMLALASLRPPFFFFFFFPQFLSIVPLEVLRWIIVMGGTAVSAFFLGMNLKAQITQGHEMWLPITVGAMLLQAGLGVLLKMYFFTTVV